MMMSRNFRVQTQFAENNTQKRGKFAGCKPGCKPYSNRGFALKVNKYRGFRGVQTWVQTLLQTVDAFCQPANRV